MQNNTQDTAGSQATLLLPPPLSATKAMEFIAGRRILNVTEQGQFKADSPELWTLCTMFVPEAA